MISTIYARTIILLSTFCSLWQQAKNAFLNKLHYYFVCYGVTKVNGTNKNAFKQTTKNVCDGREDGPNHFKFKATHENQTNLNKSEKKHCDESWGYSCTEESLRSTYPPLPPPNRILNCIFGFSINIFRTFFVTTWLDAVSIILYNMHLYCVNMRC